ISLCNQNSFLRDRSAS
ncbi:hypothetical protein QE152_g19163, partial [Popillia japonica]